MSAPGCREIAELLPWWANGSLAGAERAAVEAHLELCAKCRRELERCETERAALRAEASAAPMPHPAQLDRLFARIDAGETGDDDAPPRGGATRGLFARTPRPVRWLLAAQLFAAIGLGWLALRTQAPAPAPAAYRALSDAERPSRAASIRVVFSPDAAESEVRAILLAAGVEIVAGPTPVGAYGLATRPGVARDAALDLLRSDPRVRFAEPVAGAPEADASGR